MNNFAKALSVRGLSLKEAAKRPGCKYVTLHKYYTGDHPISSGIGDPINLSFDATQITIKTVAFSSCTFIFRGWEIDHHASQTMMFDS